MSIWSEQAWSISQHQEFEIETLIVIYEVLECTANWKLGQTKYIVLNQEQRNQDKVEKAILERHAGEWIKIYPTVVTSKDLSWTPAKMNYYSDFQ